MRRLFGFCGQLVLACLYVIAMIYMVLLEISVPDLLSDGEHPTAQFIRRFIQCLLLVAACGVAWLWWRRGTSDGLIEHFR